MLCEQGAQCTHVQVNAECDGDECLMTAVCKRKSLSHLPTYHMYVYDDIVMLSAFHIAVQFDLIAVQLWR